MLSYFRDAPLHDFPIRDEILFQYLAILPGTDVLEVGPGPGFTAFTLAPQLKQMTLVDVAPLAVEELRQTLGHLPNIRLVSADIAASDLVEQLGAKFDFAFGLDMFEYVKDPGACLTNLASVLRCGGQLLLTFPNVPPPAGDGVTWFTDLAELEGLLRDAGFGRWRIFSVYPRWFPATVYAVMHEWPLQIYRRFRAWDKRARPQVYEATWAFQNRRRIGRFKAVVHLYWALLGWVMRLGGDVFAAEPVDEQPLGRQLVVRATR